MFTSARILLRDARLSSALALACLLAGCGGEGSSTASTTASPTGDAPSTTASTGFAAAVTSMTPAGGTVPAKASATVGTPPRAEAQGAGNVSLTWQAPTENTDGSALQNLGGYIIHYGTASKQYTSQVTITNPGLTTYVVESLPAGTYYFSMTATTSAGVQSSPSSEAHTTIS